MIDIHIYSMKPTINFILGMDKVEDIKNQAGKLIPLYNNLLNITKDNTRLNSKTRVRIIGIVRLILKVLYQISTESNISIQKLKLEKLKRLV